MLRHAIGVILSTIVLGGGVYLAWTSSTGEIEPTIVDQSMKIAGGG